MASTHIETVMLSQGYATPYDDDDDDDKLQSILKRKNDDDVRIELTIMTTFSFWQWPWQTSYG